MSDSLDAQIVTDLLDALRERLAAGMDDAVRSAIAEELAKGQMTPGSPNDSSAFDLWKLYKAGQAAEILGLDRTTMYDIPECDLPRCHVGPARGTIRWLGADLLAYMKGLDPVDYEAMIEHLREQLKKPHGSVQRLSRSNPSGSPSGKKRVL